ncbi:hypothetical protein ACQZ6S_14550 [Agrobacterium tumefaciens]
MINRRLFLAAGTCCGLLVAFGSLAMPIDVQKPSPTGAVSLIDDDKSNSNDNRHELRREDDDDSRQVSNDCRSDDNDEGDDDDAGCDSHNGDMQQQNDTAPANGLFMPGSKPKVQLN